MVGKRALILLGVGLLLSGGLEAQDSQRVERDIERLLALGQARDLPRLEAFIRTQMPKWEAMTSEQYGYLMLQAVARLSSHPFEDRKESRRLAAEFAVIALGRSGAITLKDQVYLTRYARISRSIPESPEEWLLERRKNMKLWFQTWKRLNDAIDPDWTRETTYFNLAPPLETGLPSGVAPEAVKDPKLRAQYEADLQENARKAKRNLEQSQARKLKRSFQPWAIRYIVAAYSHLPGALEELKGVF